MIKLLDRISEALVFLFIGGILALGVWFMLLELDKREPVARDSHQHHVVRIPR